MKKLLLALGLSAAIFVSFLTPGYLTVGGQRFSVVTPTYANHCAFIDVPCNLGELKDGVLAAFTTNLSTLVQNVIQFIIETFVSIIGGNPQSRAAGPPQTVEQAYEQYGALGALGLGVQEMYDHPPVTTADYLATINPIVPAFAQQKTGGDALNPILPFWQLTRNLAYVFFVIVLVAIGFMIMFRSKIDPRTTVSVTAAIPGLILSLLLITFSLALAGFIIDVGRIGMDLVRNILLGTAGIGGKVPGIGAGVGLSAGDIWGSFILNFNNGVSFGGIGGAIVGAFVSLIIMVFAFIVGIQVFMMLLFRYINLIVKPIFAPFTFLFGALPGKGGNITSWFKSYLVDALTFPVVLFILNLALSIKNVPGAGVVANDPFGVFLGGASLNSILAIGIVFLATKVPAVLEDAFDIKHSANVDRAGAQPASMAKQIPIIKNFL